VQQKLGANLQKIEKLYVPVKQKKTEMIDGSPADIAKVLVEKLRNEVRAF
jgi:electron transfer flavoprotein beta subunit